MLTTEELKEAIEKYFRYLKSIYKMDSISIAGNKISVETTTYTNEETNLYCFIILANGGNTLKENISLILFGRYTIGADKETFYNSLLDNEFVFHGIYHSDEDFEKIKKNIIEYDNNVSKVVTEGNNLLNKMDIPLIIVPIEENNNFTKYSCEAEVRFADSNKIYDTFEISNAYYSIYGWKDRLGYNVARYKMPEYIEKYPNVFKHYFYSILNNGMIRLRDSASHDQEIYIFDDTLEDFFTDLNNKGADSSENVNNSKIVNYKHYIIEL